MKRVALGMFVLTMTALVQAEASFPTVEVVPRPALQIAFEIDGVEVVRYIAGDSAPKPFLYPLIGPAGKRLTTMSHPIDPNGHRHHRSVWVGHRDVNGNNFWEEKDGSRIVMTRLEAYGHEAASAWFRAAHEWRDAQGAVVLREQRTWTVTRLEAGAYYLDLNIAFSPGDEGDVTFAQTPFGFLGVRVTPPMSVKLGGGRILNSEGALDEAGVHWKKARWVDYAGPVAPRVVNGVTLFDHPKNPGSPTTWHVRDEGWMGASFTYSEARVLKEGEAMTLRYRIYVHGPDEEQDSLESHWKRFAGE
ncbi:MAG: PmoA family protein [Candidatus Hydrogenedentes bacterium]|nr:PmoA family protein [Candidatus Hydrogenedentota bacterium]